RGPVTGGGHVGRRCCAGAPPLRARRARGHRPPPADPALSRPLGARRSDGLPRPPVGAVAVPLIDERARMLDLVDRRGVSPLSFLIRYDAGWRAHLCRGGAVCYPRSPRAAVAWSDPLCADDDLPGVLGSFDAAMREQRRGVCLVAVSEQTARAAMAAGFSALKVGEEPWFDLATWERPRGDRGKKLRWL